jgi:hypothetical protein
VFLNSTRLGKDGQPAQEWDVVRLDLAPDATWTITVVESAISRAAQKDSEARDKLDFLRERLQGRFSDLKAYRTLLATVSQGQVKYEDAGRSFSLV